MRRFTDIPDTIFTHIRKNFLLDGHWLQTQKFPSLSHCPPIHPLARHNVGQFCTQALLGVVVVVVVVLVVVVVGVVVGVVVVVVVVGVVVVVLVLLVEVVDVEVVEVVDVVELVDAAVVVVVDETHSGTQL